MLRILGLKDSHMKISILTLLFLAVSLSASAATHIPLNTGWLWHRGFQGTDSQVELPHTWNSEDALMGNTQYYRGLCLYSHILHFGEEARGKRIFLRIAAAQTVADVYVDHHFVMQHRGGYTAFCVELTDLLSIGKEHKLEIFVNNAATMDIAPICGDFNIFGGLSRGCEIILTEPVCIDPTYYASSGLFVTQKQVSQQSAHLDLLTVINSGLNDVSNYTVDYTLINDGRTEQRIEGVAIKEGKALAHLDISRPHLWDGQNDPHLYTLRAELRQGDRLVDSREEQIGLRYYHADAETGFWLNGHPHRLNGVNRHQDRAERGSALYPTDDTEDLDLIEEMGCNAVRLSHYPQSEGLLSQMDRRGLVAWVEVPFVNVFVSNPMYCDNLRQQLTEIVMQYYNHPSILAWGLFNEINSGWMERPTVMTQQLHDLARSLDPSRPTTGATNQDDDFNGIPEWIAHNKYYGWYGAEPEQMAVFLDQEHAAHPERAMGLSEYGAGASIWQQQDTLSHPEPWGRWHPENWQTYYHIENWRIIQQRPWMWCNFIWCMFDFTSAGRREGSIPGRNDKGLVSYDRRDRKDAFYFYKANWNEREKLLYIAGRHNQHRHSAITDIQVFSNSGPAELFVNGVSFGIAQPDDVKVIRWIDVSLCKGANVIEVKNKKCNDKIILYY